MYKSSYKRVRIGTIIFIVGSLFLFKVSILLSEPLIKSGMNELQRTKILSKYFSPSFNEVLEVDITADINKNVKDPMSFRGIIYINPPKGHCFNITYNENKKDKRICERTHMYYKLSDLNDDGEFKLDISTDDSSSIYTYTWKSKYLFVQVYPSIKDRYVFVKKYPVMNCIPNLKTRKIELDLFFTKWFITIPEKDVMAIDFEKEFKPIEKEKVKWKLHPDKSFGLDADQVVVGDYPPSAIQSRCRYIKGVSQHKYKNMVECHNIGLYDAVRIPVSCMFK